jgi:hypothetical protein
MIVFAGVPSTLFSADPGCSDTGARDVGFDSDLTVQHPR